MSMTLPRALIFAAVLIPAAAVSAGAQRAVSIGVAAGAAAVEGSGVAPSGALSVQYQSPVRFLSFRAEGSFASRETNGAPNRVTAFTLNALLGPRPTHGIAPYVTAGVGTYLQPGSGAQPGINAGVGLRARLGSVEPFAELRTHVWSRSAASAARITPLQIGVTF